MVNDLNDLDKSNGYDGGATPVNTQADGDRRDFFISHSSTDEQWAEWIATQLERAGYTVELDVWEWGPGTNFIFAIENALRRADRVIAVYSPSYFTRPFSQAEHQAVTSSAFREHSSRVVPILVADCEIPELYRNIVRISLVDVEEEEATRRLIGGVEGIRQTVACSRIIPRPWYLEN